MTSSIHCKFVEKNYPKNLIEPISFFRKISLEIDTNPSNVKKHLHHPIFSRLCSARNMSCLERTQFLEAMSYGDVGSLLAAPGPSLSGLLLQELGSEQQQALFFDYVAREKVTSFFAVTEPNKGSDAGHMQTALQKNSDHYVLNGEKWLVGHGEDAPIGVVIARTSSGPLGITAVLLTPELISNNEAKLTLDRSVLETVGLRGACLSRLIFKECIVGRENRLGLHLRPMRRGMMAIVKTFNRMRPGVAAFAIGHAQAVLDYVREHKKRYLKNESLQLDKLDSELALARSVLYRSAERVDADPFESAYASIAKAKATKLAEAITEFSLQLFRGSCIFEHPLLLKWSRDVFGYEYMEGTTHMQLKNVYQGYKNKKDLLTKEQ